MSFSRPGKSLKSNILSEDKNVQKHHKLKKYESENGFKFQ